MAVNPGLKLCWILNHSEPFAVLVRLESYEPKDLDALFPCALVHWTDGRNN